MRSASHFVKLFSSCFYFKYQTQQFRRRKMTICNSLLFKEIIRRTRWSWSLNTETNMLAYYTIICCEYLLRWMSDCLGMDSGQTSRSSLSRSGISIAAWSSGGKSGPRENNSKLLFQRRRPRCSDLLTRPSVPLPCNPQETISALVRPTSLKAPMRVESRRHCEWVLYITRKVSI